MRLEWSLLVLLCICTIAYCDHHQDDGEYSGPSLREEEETPSEDNDGEEENKEDEEEKTSDRKKRMYSDAQVAVLKKLQPLYDPNAQKKTLPIFIPVPFKLPFGIGAVNTNAATTNVQTTNLGNKFGTNFFGSKFQQNKFATAATTTTTTTAATTTSTTTAPLMFVTATSCQNAASACNALNKRVVPILTQAMKDMLNIFNLAVYAGATCTGATGPVVVTCTFPDGSTIATNDNDSRWQTRNAVVGNTCLIWNTGLQNVAAAFTPVIVVCQ